MGLPNTRANYAPQKRIGLPLNPPPQLTDLSPPPAKLHPPPPPPRKLPGSATDVVIKMIV